MKKKNYKFINNMIEHFGYMPDDIDVVPENERAAYESSLSAEVMNLLDSDINKYREFLEKFDDYSKGVITANELFIYVSNILGSDDTKTIILKVARITDDITKRKNLIKIFNPPQEPDKKTKFDYFKNFEIMSFLKSLYSKDNFIPGNMIFFLVFIIIILVITLIIIIVLLNISLKKCE